MKKLFVLFALLACLFAASAFAESNVYGKTLTTVRVRESASASAEILDNITSSACVYILSTTQNGGYTFGQVKYRNYNGDVVKGWVCLSQNGSDYVEIMTDAEAKSFFAVSGGSLPGAHVGTFKNPGEPNATAAPEAENTSTSSSSDQVKTLQQNLKTLGYYSGSITGNIGSKTESAIKSFQKAKGLSVTGEADAATCKAAADAVSKQSSTSAPSSQSTPAPSSSATNAQIKTLQQDLKTLGYYSGSITGNIGAKTEAAIRSFQKAKGLSVTGKPDSATRSAAASAVKNTSSSSASSQSSSSGATAAQIKILQQNLKTLGYYSGSITGNLGSKTQAAIKSFQKAKGLSVTGKPDSATRSAAAKAVSAADSKPAPKKVYKLDWFAHKADFYNRIGLKNGNQAKLTDLTTGRSLNVYIQSTGSHADVEPLTAEDTKALCAIYGVYSVEKISFVRRPMLLQIGSYLMPCSIYGAPHGDQVIKNNDFPGQFCLHFLGSKTHGSNKVDDDHQNAVTRAVNIMKNRGYEIVTKAPEL